MCGYRTSVLTVAVATLVFLLLVSTTAAPVVATVENDVADLQKKVRDLEYEFGQVWGIMRGGVYEMSDPEGDDHGPGTYQRPTTLKTGDNLDKVDQYAPGVFDLLRFNISTTEDDVIFTFQFENLGGNPWLSLNGISLQFVHVYIDRDRVEGSGRTDTLTNANLDIRSEDAWEVALTIGGRWDNYNPISNQITIESENYNYRMDIWVNNEANLIVASVPVALIGKPTKDWGYAVITGSWDSGKFREVVPDNIQISVENNKYVVNVRHKVGGGDNEAILSGVHPRVMDILVPQGMTQEEVLSGYDTVAGTFAKVPAVTLFSTDLEGRLTSLGQALDETSAGLEGQLTSLGHTLENLEGRLTSLRLALDEIELTPGPQGPTGLGEAGPQGPAGADAPVAGVIAAIVISVVALAIALVVTRKRK